MRYALFAIGFLVSNSSFSQVVSLTAIGTPYIENFSGLAIPATNGSTTNWTNNSTLANWYASHSGTVQVITQQVGSVRNNTGKLYGVISGSDISLGSRASGGTGTITYGVCLQNNTGTTITSLDISYYGEQWSIAENGSNVNTLGVSYQVGSGLTSSTTGTWTNAATLNFTQIWGSANSSALGGTACTGSSAQCLSLDGNAAANRILVSACLTVTIAPGQQFFLRWSDLDDASNDHHLQIDDLSITPYDINCLAVLPVTWGDIGTTVNDNDAIIDWSVHSETMNDHFSIELFSFETQSFKTVRKVKSIGDHEELYTYRTQLEHLAADDYFYRIRQTDLDGRNSYSPIQTFKVEANDDYISYISGKLTCSREFERGTVISIVDLNGQLIFETTMAETAKSIAVPLLNPGIVFVHRQSPLQNCTDKLLVTAN